MRDDFHIGRIVCTLTVMSVETPPAVRAADAAYEHLLLDIQAGKLPAGTVLAETEQAERLGFSRTPIREAIRRLAADGLALQRSARITVVSEVNEKQVRRLFEARRAIEEACIRAAARNGDPLRFRELADRLRAFKPELESGKGFDEYAALIGEFDQSVDESVDNEYLLAPLRSIRLHLKRIRRLALGNVARVVETADEHARIAEAIADRDPERAAHAAHLHFHAALENNLRHLTNTQNIEE